MLLRWLAFLFWRPFEALSHRLPLVPLRVTVSEPVSGVKCIRIGNFVTRGLGKFGGYGYSTCYLIDDELLVDTGFGWAARSFRRLLIELEAPTKLKTLVCTHYHEDHIGNNDIVRELTQADILAHRDALSEVRFPSEKVWYRRFLFGPATPAEARAIPKHVRTSQRTLEVLEAAGHCPGHICLLEPERGWLFSGDLFISVDLDSQLADANGPQWIQSIQDALERQPTLLLGGHGEIVEGQAAVQEVLQDKLEFLKKLRARVAEVMRQGPTTTQQITKQVFGSRGLTNKLSFSDGWLSILTSTDFSRSNLVRTFVQEIVAQQEAQNTPRGPTPSPSPPSTRGR